MNIFVTQKHIDQSKELLGNKIGFFHDRFIDPIALAIREAFKTERVMVHTYMAEVDGTTYTISTEATEFCYKWSRGEECQPFTLTIEYVSGRITNN